MPKDNNDGILLLLGSGLLIATYFATKQTKQPDEGEEGWPDMPEMEMEDMGPFKKKGKQRSGNAEERLIAFAENSQGTLQKLLHEAQLLAQEVERAQQ